MKNTYWNSNETRWIRMRPNKLTKHFDLSLILLWVDVFHNLSTDQNQKKKKVISFSALGRNVSGNWRLFVFTAPVFSANLNNPHCSLKTHLFPKTLRNQGRNMFEIWKPLLTASSCLWNPHDTERGCLLAPTQSPGVLGMDCLSSFLHGYRGRVCSASPPESSLRRGDWRRPLGVFIVFTGLQASHDCMNVDRLTGHPSALNCTICLRVCTISVHVSLKWMNDQKISNLLNECD